MHRSLAPLILALLLHCGLSPMAMAQAGRNEPKLACIYPAGAQTHTTTTCLVWGQNFRQVEQAYASHPGISVKVVKTYRPPKNLDDDERTLFKWTIACRKAEILGTTKPPVPMYQPNPDKQNKKKQAQSPTPTTPAKPAIPTQPASSPAATLPPASPAKPSTPTPAAKPTASSPAQPATPAATAPDEEDSAPSKARPQTLIEAGITLPDIPLIDLLPKLDLRAIESQLTLLQRRDRSQQNNQIAEMALLEVRVAPNTPAGFYEIRLQGKFGLTNPIRFEVSPLPNYVEYEPNESTNDSGQANQQDAAKLPCTVNGQINAGDVDVWKFYARKGAKLCLRANARSLIPFLADAVPGWFQMVMLVRNPRGEEVAYNDDFRFNPDPAMFFTAPEDGYYSLEIHDSIFRGREDFIYRVDIGELPFVSSIFPMGTSRLKPTQAKIRGWNLPQAEVLLDAANQPASIQSRRVTTSTAASNPFEFAVSDLPELMETEPNDASKSAQTLNLPCVINGHIDHPSDVDVFQFQGKKGQAIAIEITARRLQSPLDSCLYLLNEQNQVIAWNDDAFQKDGHMHLDESTLTHFADSKIHAILPKDGTYRIKLIDIQHHGGQDFAYRLSVHEAAPDFDVFVCPSAVNLASGGLEPITVFARRLNGYTGPIELALSNAPPGFSLQGNVIPSGASSIRMTLSTQANQANGQFTPSLVAKALKGETKIERAVTPADDCMQAFLWRHLLPAQQWLVTVAPGKGKRSPIALDPNQSMLTIVAGQTSTLDVPLPSSLTSKALEPELNGAPTGISIVSSKVHSKGISITLAAAATMTPQASTNVLIDLYQNNDAATPIADDKKKKNQFANRPLIANLPAIPVIIEQP